MTTDHTERNALEAWLYGWSNLLLLIAGTLAVCVLILAACGGGAGELWWALPLLLGAGILRCYSRLARE